MVLGSGSGSNAVAPPNNEGVPPANAGVPPLNLLLILKEESGVDLFSLSNEGLRDKLLTGLILRDKEFTEKQFYWMDQQSGKNCFMLLPKSLKISADSSPRVVSETETRGTGREITLPRVKYEGVRRLQVGGKFGTMGLSSGRESEYEVVLYLQVMPTRGTTTTQLYITSNLYLPDGTQTRNPWEYVGRIPTQTWHPFKVGRFKMNPANIGELSFDLVVYIWYGRDILIKGVAIIPLSTK